MNGVTQRYSLNIIGNYKRDLISCQCSELVNIFDELALDCRDAVVKLKADEADLWNQRFQLNQKYYESRIEQYQAMYDVMDSYIEQSENTGRISANTYREKQIKQEENKVKLLTKEYDSLEKKMMEALKSGEISYGSEGYYDMLTSLKGVNQQIVDAKTNITELDKSIQETNWNIFDKGAEAIRNMNDELEFVYKLLGSDEDFYSDKGVVTDEGIAAFGILSSQYNLSLQEHKKYASEIKKINAQLKDDPYNQNLIDRRKELYEADRKAIESSNDYKKSIVDLVEVGIKAQIDSMKELISKYEDLMDAQKDEFDYAKKVAQQQESINTLQKQLNAYANDDTEEGRSRRQKLQSSIKAARESLAQTEEDRRISQTKKLLSELQEEYETILNARLDDVDSLIQAVVDGVNVNGATIAAAIEEATGTVGYIMSSDLATLVTDAKNATADLVSYFTNGDFVNKVTDIANAVTGIDKYYADAQKDAEAQAAKDTKTETNKSNATTTAARNNANKTSGKDGNWVNKTGASGKVYRASWQFNDGSKATGWSQIDKQWYYFDANGKLKTGLQTVGNDKYYIRQKSGKATSEWVTINGKQYYFKADGKAVGGWQKVEKNGKKSWYFFDPTTNAMVTNAWIHSKKVTKSPVKGDYYVNSSGVSVSGKVKIGSKTRTFGSDRKWKGYRSGTQSVPYEGLYWTNEGSPETIVRKSDGAVLTKLNQGDTVFNGDATKTMWDFANNPEKFLRGMGVNNTYGSGNNVNLEFNLSGLRSPSEFMDALRKDKRFEKLIQEMTLGRVNGHGTLAKNAIRF